MSKGEGKEVFSLGKGNIWAIVVSVKHHSVRKLVKQLIAIGVNPTRIIVITNVTTIESLLQMGILEENIIKKGVVGYAGALIAGTERIIQYDPGAIIVNLSSEFTGFLDDISGLILEATKNVRRIASVIIGSTETEDGIAIWPAEALMTAVQTKGVRKKGTKFKELTTNLSQVTIL